jgi:hypothetical protein
MKEAVAAVAKHDEYEQKAAECLELARRSKDEWSKAMLLEMAQSWIKLAMKAKGELPESEGEY